MGELKVLTICHNHPALHPGGTEIFAHDLFTELKTRPGINALFLACTDDLHRTRQPGTVFQSIGRSSDEFLLWTGHFDRFNLAQIDLLGIIPEISRLLETWRPDVVHLQHYLMIGLEILPVIRRIVPQAKIVVTLHDYYAICANDGQMVTPQGRLCTRSSPDSCRGCFPDIEFSRFVLREHQIKTLFAMADHFVSPSRFLADRYITWGLPADRISVIANGLPEIAPPAPRLAADGHRNRFGFFGHINRYKGALVALEAARLLEAADIPFSLTLHGSDAFQSEAFQGEFRSAVGRAGSSVRWEGGYERSELPRLMRDVDWVLVPSIWWENAPLVIQEAHRAGLPVICSDIGGMAEAVRDGIDGLHVAAGDARDLARTMRRAADDADLWRCLVAGIVSPPGIAVSANRYLALFKAPRPANRLRDAA